LFSARSPVSKLKIDNIGYWSEVKLDIIREYARAYSSILSARRNPSFEHVYIDAFAGAGHHVSKTSGEEIDGSPVNAVETEPPFREYHLIDLNGARAEHLRQRFSDRSDVSVYEGDCNNVLLEHVFPRVRYEDFRRGLCVLDPYGLTLRWETILAAGQSKTMDVFLNFPIMDMNRNVFWHNPEKVDPADIARMNTFWGDESWRQVVYQKPVDRLFDPGDEKQPNEVIAQAFAERLRDVAGFANVPNPIPMRNSIGRIVYYLYFASQKPVAQKIVNDIFRKYRNRGAGS
jgi:three-Cys-motif partner protein